jgi:hypothetical protein
MVLAKNLFLIIFILTMAACAAAPQPLPPRRAQQALARVWHADAHIIWEIDWPDAPLGGPLVVETWRAGDRYRFEILEAASPALRGETLVFDGRVAWRYNRFQPPALFEPTSPVLSPVSDAFAMIDRLLLASPELAIQEAVYLNDNLTQKIELTFPNADQLILWFPQAEGLPLRVVFLANSQQVTLQAREAEPLPNPPDQLFGVGDWINNLR